MIVCSWFFCPGDVTNKNKKPPLLNVNIIQNALNKNRINLIAEWEKQ